MNRPAMTHGLVELEAGVNAFGAQLGRVLGEEHQRGQSGRSDRVALGHGLGGVADRVERIGDAAHRLVQVGHLGDAAGVVGHRPVGVESDDQPGHRQLRHDRDADAVQALLGVVAASGQVEGGENADRDHDHRRDRGLHAPGEAGDDVGRVPGLRGRRDRLDRGPAGARVELGDRHQQEGDGKTDERRQVELAEREQAAVVGHHDRDEAGGGEQRGHDHALVESVHDRARAADAGEEGADDRGEDRDCRRSRAAA